MNIAVLIKQVPDTETRLKVSDTSIVETGIKWIVSPFDEHALEAALQLKEKNEGSTITAISLGPDRVVEALKTAFAFGVDRAVHIKDDAYNVLDISYTAAALAGYLKTESFDLILTGHTAIDSQSSMVPAMIAESLDCPNINQAVGIAVNGSEIDVKRDIEGGTAHMVSPFPVVVTATKGLNQPRYPSLKNVMAAKKKQPEQVAAESVAGEIRKIEVISMELPPARPPARIIEGDSAAAKAAELARALKDEAKVI